MPIWAVTNESKGVGRKAKLLNPPPSLPMRALLALNMPGRARGGGQRARDHSVGGARDARCNNQRRRNTSRVAKCALFSHLLRGGRVTDVRLYHRQPACVAGLGLALSLCVYARNAWGGGGGGV